MKKIKILFLFIACFIFFSKPILSKENKILLKLNNEIITSVDILNEIKYLSILNSNFSTIAKNEQINIAKNSLIKQKVKKIEIKKYRTNLEIENKVFENIIKNYFFNLQIEKIKDFNFFFKKRNLNTNFVKEKIIIETLWNKLIFEKFSKNVKIDKNEIELNIKKSKIKKEYLLSEIVFNLKENEKFEQKLKSILSTANEKSFSEAALIFSLSDSSYNGGKLGWIKEEILSKNIRDQILARNIGEITKPIIIPGGFLILFIEDIKETEIQINTEKEIKDIIERKTNAQLNQLSNVYLNKLKKNIEINEL